MSARLAARKEDLMDLEGLAQQYGLDLGERDRLLDRWKFDSTQLLRLLLEMRAAVREEYESDIPTEG